MPATPSAPRRVRGARPIRAALSLTALALALLRLTPTEPVALAQATLAFSDVTAGTLGSTPVGGHGAMFADASGDGLPDLYITMTTGVAALADLFYLNQGGSFSEEGAARGIADLDFGSHGAAWADLDNDGDYDLINGTTSDSVGLGAPNDVFRNDGSGFFTEVTPGAMAGRAEETRAVLALDIEGDGDLDVFTVSGASGSSDPVTERNEVYRNDGGLQLTALTSGALYTAPAGQGATDTDYDGDGDIDVIAANRDGDLNILRNDGQGDFGAVSPGAIGIVHRAFGGITSGDIDGDGDLDMVMGGLIATEQEIGHLYRNDGDGTFSFVRSFGGVDGYMGGLADLDNDGDLDLVFAGDDLVYVNDGAGNFANGPAVPVGGIDDPRAIAFADVDGDGDLDFAIGVRRTVSRLIRNDTAGANWMKVKLTSPGGQAGAFGAKVRIFPATQAGGTLLGLREARSNHGYLAQDDPVLHFGLGSRTEVDVVVTFLDGTTRTMTSVAANQTIAIDGTAPPPPPPPPTDSDGDGLPDDWETQFGLNPGLATGDDGAAGDPDGDGQTNAQELAGGTHPRGHFTRFFAEGATGSNFFGTRFAVANPGGVPGVVLCRFQKTDGSLVSRVLEVPSHGRSTLDSDTVAGLEAAEFSTVIESDVRIVADRTMTWDQVGRYGSHAAASIGTSATTWHLAEGATHSGFNLFYLIQNPNPVTAVVQVTYLRPGGAAPVVKSYAVAPNSRFNIWVNDEGPQLAHTDVSAVIQSTNGVTLIVERAMYLDSGGQRFGAGHESAGVTAPAVQWFLAEGATGDFFDLFVLLSNPSATAADVRADYLLPDGTTVTRQYTVPAASRFNVWVDREDPLLSDTAVSTLLTSTNGVAFIAERAMWWPGPTAATWTEAHNSPGSTETGSRWGMAEGEVGGPADRETYILIANTSSFDAAVTVTLLFEDGTTAQRVFGVGGRSRFNVNVAAALPEAAGRRFGAVVEALGGAQLVVERAMYASAIGAFWEAGTNALATKLP